MMDAKKISTLFDNHNFAKWFGRSKVVDDAGNPLTVYHGSDAEISAFDPDLIGKNYTPHYGNGFYFIGNPHHASEYGKNVMPVNLSLQNPAKWSLSMVEAAKKNGMEVSEYAASLGHDGFSFGDKYNPQFVAFEPTQVKSVNNRGTFDPSDPNIYRTALPFAAGAGLMSSMLPGAAEAARIREMDAPLEDAWNPLEAFAGGVPGGLKAAAMGVLPDGAMDWAFNRIGGLMSGGGK